MGMISLYNLIGYDLICLIGHDLMASGLVGVSLGDNEVLMTVLFV